MKRVTGEIKEERKIRSNAKVKCPDCGFVYCKATGVGATLEVKCPECGTVYVAQLKYDLLSIFKGRRLKEAIRFSKWARGRVTKRQHMRYARASG